MEAVKLGMVEECEEYEYLGFWVNKNGNCLLQVEKKTKKIKGEMVALKSLASYHNVGPKYNKNKNKNSFSPKITVPQK